MYKGLKQAIDNYHREADIYRSKLLELNNDLFSRDELLMMVEGLSLLMRPIHDQEQMLKLTQKIYALITEIESRHVITLSHTTNAQTQDS